jgi:hypothetical protein
VFGYDMFARGGLNLLYLGEAKRFEQGRGVKRVVVQVTSVLAWSVIV